MTFGNYQFEVYLKGMGGQTPDFPMSWADLEAQASAAMEVGARGYVFGSAGTEDTERENRAAFARHRIVPRMLRDVAVRDLRTTILGVQHDAPVLLAPVGVQSIVHPDGELAAARGASAAGIGFVASTAASYSMEEIAAAGADVPRWYQLYWPKDPELTASFVTRAEAAGYGAIVVTLDTGLLAWRPRDLQTAYLPFLKSVGIANYLSDPVFRGALAQPPEDNPTAAVLQFVAVFSNPAVTWADLAALREMTRLPILLKGILHPDDARLARDHGVSGVVVSNHGGRQVDGAIAALDALPDVVDAVGDELEVLFDSGIRCGADVVKAIALGARAVLLGRPYLWGMALGGADGVTQVLRNLLSEIDLTLALSGHASLRTVNREMLRGLGA
ncbi:MAG: lactate 2-monooxygenase [Mycobacterium sp.]|jgi:isopentenyl diphosphate isomerase/L-lactate dehydrogenase-like FMN-dependent dehydrogenase|nr:lactate 2-monooxygenase [Mycobacterium sp.]